MAHLLVGKADVGQGEAGARNVHAAARPPGTQS